MENDRRGNKALIAASLVASLTGSGGGVYAVIKTVEPAHFTEFSSEIHRLRADLERHREKHPDAVNGFDRRITRLETQVQTVIDNQNKILERLYKL